MHWKRHILHGVGVCLLLLISASTAHAQRGRVRIVRTPVFASPFYFPYYDPFFWDFYGWGPGPYPYPQYGRQELDDAAARLQVTPRETEVYVDGYLVGTVDDFDGMTQRLRVTPGEHVIELYLDKYKPATQTIVFQRGQTYRIRHTMEPLASGEAAPARPMPKPPAAGTPAPTERPYDAFGRRPPPPPGMRGRDRGMPGAGAGMLSIRVQPADAVILIDGEKWEGSGTGPLEVQVTPGPHRVEVQKDGYQPFATTVQVRPGDPTPLNVSLTRGGGQ